MSAYRAGTLKRQRRTNDELEQLDAQIIEVLTEDHPQNVRHVFYRMSDPRLPEPVEKSDRGYRHVQDRCVKLRRSGRIAYSWIGELSRRGYFVNAFSSASDFIERMSGNYRADLWQHSEYRCGVWAESRSIASVLLQDCNRLDVDLYPCGGFFSLLFVHEVTQQYNLSDDDRDLVVLYVGDYDSAGVLIDQSLERVMRLYLKPEINLDFRRIAINKIQVYDLPTKPRKEGNKRSQQVAYTAEAEAMPARILRSLLVAEIDVLPPAHALNVAKLAEQSEKAHLARMAKLLGGVR